MRKINNNFTLITVPNKKFKFNKSIFLGEWCVRNSARTSKAKIISHHWNKIKKRNNDYKYLEKNYEKILNILINRLNEIHGVKKKLGYWRIIVGPWLIFYIATMFDRWEVLRSFFKEFKGNKVNILYNKSDRNKILTYDTQSFHDKASQNDEWNYLVFLRILENEYSNKIEKIEAKDLNFKKDLKNPKRKSLLKFLFFLADDFLSLLAIRFNSIIIENPYFPKIDLIKIFTKIGQIPAFFSNTFNYKKNTTLSVRSDLRNIDLKNLGYRDKFIKFLLDYIFDDLPMVFVEDYENINKKNDKFNSLKKKLIIATTCHVFNERFKFWMAKMHEKGSKIQIISHGGFLPTDIHGFFHDEVIADKYLAWNKLITKNSKCLPPLQLRRYKNYSNQFKENCLIIEASVLPYAVKCQAWPYAENYKNFYNTSENFIKKLKSKIKQKVVYRIVEGDDGFSLGKKIKSKFNYLKISTPEKERLVDSFKRTKIIICKYPETPTSEAFFSDIPLVIILPKNTFSQFFKYKNIIQDLKKNKILFDNSTEAAKHVNKIWENIDQWWQDSEIVKCRNRIKKTLVNLDDDWLGIWSKHIRRSVAYGS